MSDDKKINFEGIDEISENSEKFKQESVNTEPLSSEEVAEIEQEVKLEDEFGDSPIRTFAESAISSATFGIAPKAFVEGTRLFAGDKAAAEAQAGLREREARNPIASTTGDIAGVVAPALLSGGTSLAAKTASAGVATAAKAGLKAEGITAKALAKILGESGRKKLAKEVIVKSISKGTGSAVEGAAFGAGQLLKEDALGKADFNAENLLAHAGSGAIFGGAVGGVFGVGSAIIPVVKNGKVVDYVSKKISNVVDKAENAAELAGFNAIQKDKLRSTAWGEKIYKGLPDFFTKKVKLERGYNVSTIRKRVESLVKTTGDDIGNTLKKIDDDLALIGTNINKTQLADDIIAPLNKKYIELAKSGDIEIKKQADQVLERINGWKEWGKTGEKISAQDINIIKTRLQKNADFDPNVKSFTNELNVEVSESVRSALFKTIDGLPPQLAQSSKKLQDAFLDYGTAVTIQEKIIAKEIKESSKKFIENKDILLGVGAVISGSPLAATTLAVKKFAESDFKRKLVLLSNVEKANAVIGKKISTGLKSFVNNTKKVAVPASTKALLSSGFIQPINTKKRKKVKTKKEAFEAISENLNKLVTDSDALSSYLERNQLIESQAAPNTGNAVNQSLITAISFLESKIPKDPAPGSGLFSRKFEPSSLEIAKFERYLEAVENPTSVLNDLESGSLTREGVEAVKSVYPNLYNRIQNEAIEQISENQNMEYSKRIQLGMLLELDSDSSLIAANITGLQQTFADKEQAQTAAIKDNGAVPTTQGGLEQIDQANDAKSQSEKIATRE